MSRRTASTRRRTARPPRPDYRVIIYRRIQSYEGPTSTHIHLIVEAASRKALWKGMEAFSISAARQINASTGCKHGQVFADRYHARALTSPRQVRNCIASVLNNERERQHRRGNG